MSTNSKRPLLLDLFCGAGGCSMGYHRAGFDVIGVDLKRQKNYPFPFVQADALRPPFDLSRFDAIHASPPCQGYSIMRNLPYLKGKKYPLLIDPVREMLAKSGRPWVIENVMGANLDAGYLCGRMFGLSFYRHRLFETSFFWLCPPHPQHQIVLQPGRGIGNRARKIVYSEVEDKRGIQTWPGRRGRENGTFAVIPGHGNGAASSREVMGVEWMSRDEAGQAIPPAYTKWIGERLMEILFGVTP